MMPWRRLRAKRVIPPWRCRKQGLGVFMLGRAEHITRRAVTTRKHQDIDAAFRDRPRCITRVFWPGLGPAQADGGNIKTKVQREVGTHAARSRNDGECV